MTVSTRIENPHRKRYLDRLIDPIKDLVYELKSLDTEWANDVITYLILYRHSLFSALEEGEQLLKENKKLKEEIKELKGAKKGKKKDKGRFHPELKPKIPKEKLELTVGCLIDAGNALIYPSNLLGERGQQQYFKNDPIYTVLWIDKNFVAVRHHSLNAGTTGFFKKKDVVLCESEEMTSESSKKSDYLAIKEIILRQHMSDYEQLSSAYATNFLYQLSVFDGDIILESNEVKGEGEQVEF